MNRFSLILSVILSCNAVASQPFTQENPCITHALRQSADADWLVVGAGASGIAVIGVLLDIGVPQQRITWLDPEFNVGRMGEFYTHVPGNSKAKEFIEFINACNAFKECSGPDFDYLRQLDLDHRGYELGVFIRPLKIISDHLRTLVKTTQDAMISLNFEHDVWHVGTQAGKSISANHVILATGSHPKVLPYETCKVISLDYALDPHILTHMIKPDDCVGVVGSSHSAVLILKYLTEMSVKKIYNFYKHPLQYAIDMGDWTLNRFTGLKGIAAEWAHAVLEKNPPAHLTRVFCTNESCLQHGLKLCDKVIYAIGYERNDLPHMNENTPIAHYQEKTGFIAPRLFGLGIAFPELTADKLGNPGYCIGFDCFMEYAQRLVPQWVSGDDIFKQTKMHYARTQLHRLKKVAELFTIYQL